MTQPANTRHDVREVLPESDHDGPFLHDIDAKGVSGSKPDDGYHRRSIFETTDYELNELGESSAAQL
ncbi:MAG: hypothetical protein V5B40_09180 [Candidatus Accumulibacter meliphilus]|jgi:hypothetical protein|uniref:hypothetical protein n=1 Tax=Candidatus Accumulibacter meliphilus TaxID=2211374 RepID=UPI002FC2CD7C